MTGIYILWARLAGIQPRSPFTLRTKKVGAERRFDYWGNFMPVVPRVQKKFRETKFFFGHMSQSAGSTRLDHDHLEFYLSAFLSAARSVTDFFEYQAWWSQWKA